MKPKNKRCWIKELAWRVRGRDRQAYNFTYDHLSRLTAATYHDVNASNTATASNRYNETLAYDLRGNITSLQRTGYYSSTCNYGQIDNLTYTYTANTNRLASIADSAPASQKTHGFNPGAGGAGYTYDANGNLKTDSYKGITNIAYNHLNLPNSITFSSGNTIEWLYDAAGMKLRKIVKQGATIQYEQTYAGGLEYRKNGTGSNRVEAIYHAEGRYLNLNAEVNNTLLWQKEYALRDHLGNSRMMFADKNANGIVETPGEIVQENHYYPFGLNLEGPWLMNDVAARDNKYQYNGKEWNDDWGLKWNDYGARWYDPAIGRWGAVDPLVEKFPGWAPYSYAFNNPIRFVDLDGMEPADPPTTETIHKIDLRTKINSMTNYVGTFSLQETKTTTTTNLGRDSGGRFIFNITTESTQITREFNVSTDGMEGEVVLISESKNSSITETQYLALGRNTGFFSPEQENVIDYAGGPLKQQTTQKDGSSVKASPLFDKLSGREQGLVKSGDATAFKEMKQSSEAGRALTYIGGAGLIPTPVTQGLGGIGTLVGVINQIRADHQQPNQAINLHYERKVKQ